MTSGSNRRLWRVLFFAWYAADAPYFGIIASDTADPTRTTTNYGTTHLRKEVRQGGAAMPMTIQYSIATILTWKKHNISRGHQANWLVYFEIAGNKNMLMVFVKAAPRDILQGQQENTRSVISGEDPINQPVRWNCTFGMSPVLTCTRDNIQYTYWYIRSWRQDQVSKQSCNTNGHSRRRTTYNIRCK